jgi:hypothetical protein
MRAAATLGQAEKVNTEKIPNDQRGIAPPLVIGYLGAWVFLL